MTSNMTADEQRLVDQAICRRVLESFSRVGAEHHVGLGETLNGLHLEPLGQGAVVDGAVVEQRHLDAVEIFRQANRSFGGPAGHISFRIAGA